MKQKILFIWASQVKSITKDISEKKGIPIGVFVEQVEVDSPAMQVGIQNGDVIIELNGEK